jgi:1,4-alpha-glucan branching enzyme
MSAKKKSGRELPRAGRASTAKEGETHPAEVAAARPAPAAEEPWTPLGDVDLHLFNEGNHSRLYRKLGAHPIVRDRQRGTHFAVWAPNAEEVRVFGDFNGWDKEREQLVQRGMSGIWEAFVPGAAPGQRYKYHVVSRYNGYRVDKMDPFGFGHEVPPKTGSVITELGYTWNDADWMSSRAGRNDHAAPISIYEVHLGSWMRLPEEGDRSLTYREIAPKLAAHVRELGFTHVELLPVMEHPFYGSWGYQVSGFFAPTSRYGSPQDLMFLIDTLHQAGIGVILDWVPAHFPQDEHALGFFDGTHLFEHEDARRGVHPDWGSFIFNYGRREVRSFLLSNALFWLDVYHADGLRVDGVASMLYLDYSRPAGEWVPNWLGGRENLDAIDLLRFVNQNIHERFPDTQAYAEESTSWPQVSRPVEEGGLGFGFKWDMGWMNDTLEYLRKDPIHRRFHHWQLTFRGVYAFTESFVLALSHDEAVHGKGSLLKKMPGDDWQKLANLRMLFAYMFALPGKKLLFMGSELASWNEWNHDASLDWHLLDYDRHRGVRDLVAHLNRAYVAGRSLHELDCQPEGFEWIEANDADQSVVSFLRKSRGGEEAMAVVCNFTPVPRTNFRIGVDRPGWWREIVNSNAREFGGSGHGNLGAVEAAPVPSHGRRWSLNLTLPPLGVVYLEHEGEDD